MILWYLPQFFFWNFHLWLNIERLKRGFWIFNGIGKLSLSSSSERTDHSTKSTKFLLYSDKSTELNRLFFALKFALSRCVKQNYLSLVDDQFVFLFLVSVLLDTEKNRCRWKLWQLRTFWLFLVPWSRIDLKCSRSHECSHAF